MGFLDQAKDKLTQAVNQHGDKIKDGLDKAGDTINQKTGGKYADQIAKGKAAAARGIDSLDDQGASPTTTRPAESVTPESTGQPGPGQPPTVATPEPGTASSEPGLDTPSQPSAQPETRPGDQA